MPSRVEIQCECAFTYMNAVFRKKLTDALAVDANHVDIASDTTGAFGDGRDRARFCRTTATCIWGVSDPSRQGPGPGPGGGRGGRSRPGCHLSADRASSHTHARHKTPREFPVSNCLTHNNLRNVSLSHTPMASRRSPASPRPQEGDHSSRPRRPPSVRGISDLRRANQG